MSKIAKIVYFIAILLLLGVSSGYSQEKNDLFALLDEALSDNRIEMATCSAGSFKMGSPLDEDARYKNEFQHKVTFTKPYQISKYEITQAQYLAIMGENPSYFKFENNPVENVSWEEAKSFCDKLNEKYKSKLPSGYRFDLPTEAQWEYACRAGTETQLNSGKNLTTRTGKCPNLEEVSWYYENSDKKTHPVGMKKANAWGIYDMHGNVWEWVRDWYGKYSDEETIDPTGPEKSTKRVFRGASWGDYAMYHRSARRIIIDPYYRFIDLGFRIVLTYY